MKYRYKGMTRNRDTVSGEIEAPNVDEAKKILFQKQIRALNVEKIRTNIDLKSLDLSLGTPINLKGLIIFTRQLSSLINSGVSVVVALQILAQQERRPAFKKILVAVKDNLEAGGGFSEGLARYPKVFSEFFIRVVEAGEVSGSLDKSLIRIGQQLDKLAAIRRKVIGAMTYPLITLVVAAGVVTFLLYKVFPEIVKMYGDVKNLPWLTQSVLQLSEWLQANIGKLFSGIVTFVVLIRWLYSLPPVKTAVDPLLIRVPVIGLLILRSGVAIFTRTLATLLSSGVPLLTAFSICEKVSSNYAIKKCIRDAASAVSEGQSISHGLGKSGLMPGMVIHMIGIGEMTGRLDELLLKISDIFDDEVDDAVGLMTTLLQPALIVVVGAIVMTLMLAMYMPIFGMVDKIGGH
ncbi:MAG: type II secretion system F family protein [Proteobacteria bacterium]|nr:type II secretion system F family protein [Pseudomonadota bacterium]